MSDQSFPKSIRIKSAQQFAAAINDGRYAADSMLVINAVRNELPFSRLGVTIPKKAGNSPLRNRWKRLIRESFRTQKQLLPAGFDYIVRPRRGAEPTFDAIRRSMVSLCKRAAARGRPSPRGG